MKPARPHRFANRVGGAGEIEEDSPPVGSSTSAMPNVRRNSLIQANDGFRAVMKIIKVKKLYFSVEERLWPI
jgi:hypothetical protein